MVSSTNCEKTNKDREYNLNYYPTYGANISKCTRGGADRIFEIPIDCQDGYRYTKDHKNENYWIVM